MTSTGFAFKSLSDREIEILQQEWLQDVFSWEKDRIIRAMGMLNAFTYHAAIGGKAARKTASGRFVINKEKLAQLASKKLRFVVTIKGLQTYLKKWWNQAGSEGKGVRGNTLRDIREELDKVFGILKYTPRKFGPGRETPPIRDFDIQKALVLYELLERVLREKYADEIKERADSFDLKNSLNAILPKHLGYFCVKLFNALFDRVRAFGRQLLQAYDGREDEEFDSLPDIPPRSQRVPQPKPEPKFTRREPDPEIRLKYPIAWRDADLPY